MNILFIGKFYPQKMLSTIVEDGKGFVGMSNHNFEMSLINGLCHHREIQLNCLTIPNVYSFPYHNKKLFSQPESYDYNNTHIYSVGFCNLPIIKEIWSRITLTIQILKYILRCKDNRLDIIVNTPNNNILSAISVAKIFTKKKITQTVIIPDIPSMVTSMDKQNPIKGAILRYLNKKSMQNTSCSNGVVLLTEAMLDFLLKSIKYIVMEGIVDVESMDSNKETVNSDKEIILYTGTLRKIFGVMNLVEAFQKMNTNNAELWICGSGDSQQQIIEATKSDSRIKFFGLVDSQTALKMQHEATILVNPRTSQGEYTKYSFPSKTMEYLLSGKSVIINRLPGIPEEYYKYVYTPNDESVESLSECISNVLSIDLKLRQERGILGRNFIISQKNSQIQTERILNLIKSY